MIAFCWLTKNRNEKENKSLDLGDQISLKGNYFTEQGPQKAISVNLELKVPQEKRNMEAQIITLKCIRATFNFWKFKVARNATYKTLLNFAKTCALSCLSNVDNIKEITVLFFNYKSLKL